MAYRRPTTFASTVLLFLAAGLAGAGCGSPDTVTIVDPNADSTYETQAESRPVARYGQDAVLRATAVVRSRGELAVARRLLREGEQELALEHVALAQRALAPAAGRLELAHPRRHRDLHEAFGQIQRSRGQAPGTSDLAAVGALLEESTSLLVPTGAAQDPDFQVAVLSSVLLEGVQSYEQSLVGGNTVELPHMWRTSWGLLELARRSLLSRVRTAERRDLEARLTRTLRQAFPRLHPPPREAVPAAELEERVIPAMDELIESSRIDLAPAPPSITAATALDELADELQAVERLSAAGSGEAALRRLRSAVRRHLVPASSGLAAVDPAALTQLEQGTIQELPRLLAAGTEPTATTRAGELADLATQSAASLRHEVELLAGAE